MAVLGIESTAHTFGAGICEKGRILANRKIMYPIWDKGLIPAKVAEFHAANTYKVIRGALTEAGLGVADISGIGYTKGPGLGPCLSVGMVAAKTIAVKNDIPLFPVNHAVGHIEVTKQAFHVKDPLVLYVSGGNSQIVALSDERFRHYMVYGETLDVGIGNMLDSFARAAGILPAWGSEVARAALGGSYIKMPYTVKGMDFTFTGLLTFATRALENNSVRDVAYSMQETAFSMLCEATERALLLSKKKDIVVCGGVAQSDRLKQMLGSISRENRANLFAATNDLNADNGAMIALVAEKMQDSGQSYAVDDCGISQRYRLDSVKITW